MLLLLFLTHKQQSLVNSVQFSCQKHQIAHTSIELSEVFSLIVNRFYTGQEKLCFLVHKNLYSSRKVQENVVRLVILCTLWHYMVHVFASSCTSLCTKWKCYGKMKQCSNILLFLQEGLKGYPSKGNPDFSSHGKLYVTWLWS